MKNLIGLFYLVLFLTLAVTGCQPGKDKSDQTESTEASDATDSTSNEHIAKVQYTCTMHPEVLEDEPGKCPKCGMDLMKKEGHAHDSTEHEQ